MTPLAAWRHSRRSHAALLVLDARWEGGMHEGGMLTIPRSTLFVKFRGGILTIPRSMFFIKFKGGRPHHPWKHAVHQNPGGCPNHQVHVWMTLTVMGMCSECGTRGGAVQRHHESPPSHSPHIVCVGNHQDVVRDPKL